MKKTLIYTQEIDKALAVIVHLALQHEKGGIYVINEAQKLIAWAQTGKEILKESESTIE